MTFHNAPVSSTKAQPGGTGISASLRFTKSGGKVRIAFTITAQRNLFGGSIAGQRFACAVGRGSDEGRIKVAAAPEGDFEAKPFLGNGGVTLTLGAWDLLPREDRPRHECKIAKVDAPAERETSIVLQLPDWASPSKPGGRMEAEHRLEPVPRRAQDTVRPAGSERLATQAAALGRAAKG